MTRAIPIIIATVCSVVWQLAAQEPPQAPVFRSTSEGVRVDVSVRQGNRPVTGLRSADFELRDRNVVQEIIGLTYENVPIDITVGLDISRSVDGALLTHLRQSVRDLSKDLRKQDRIKLVSFNMRVLRQVTFTNDERAIERALASLVPSGSTSVVDMMAVALVSAPPSDRRHLIMLFTDGSDTNSITAPASLIETARRSLGAVSFVVGGLSRKEKPKPSFFVETIANETGGRVLPVALGEDLSQAFRRLLEEFRTSYVLMYRPTGVDGPGYHPIDVTLKRPGTFELRARRGYAR